MTWEEWKRNSQTVITLLSNVGQWIQNVICTCISICCNCTTHFSTHQNKHCTCGRNRPAKHHVLNQLKPFPICGNKMPTRCSRGFYCRSYCLLNMFWAPLCPSSGAEEYYTVVAACGIFVLSFSSRCSGVELRVMCPVCRMLQTGKITLGYTQEQQLQNHSTKYHRQQPLYNTFELLMMGILVPETCWASSKICNKNLCCI